MLVLSSVITAAVIILVSGSGFSVYRIADYKIYDLFTSLVEDKDTSKSIVIVDIDDETLSSAGQWPWPRYRMARLLMHLRNSGAAAVGLDIVFSEQDRTSITSIKDAYKHEFGIDIEVEGLPEELKDNDKLLAQVIDGGPFILSNFFFSDYQYPDTNCILHPLNVIEGKGVLPEPYRAKGFLCNRKVFSQSAEYKGFFNAFRDRDGALRRLPLLAKYNGDYYPSLALATFLSMQEKNSIEIGEDSRGYFVKVWGRKIPVDKHGNVLFNIKGEKGFYNYISAVDILTGDYKPEDIRGKIVFIGSTAVGLNDLHNVAGTLYFPGVEVHATFVDNLINRDFFSIPKWGRDLEIGLILFFSLIVSLALSFRNNAITALTLPVGLGLVLSGSLLLLEHTHMYVSPLAVVVALFAVFLISISLNYSIEMRRSLQWANILARTHEAAIESMATVAETRDPETGAHIIRTQNYVKRLAEHMSDKPEYKKILTKRYIELLYISAPMHDIGKVGVPDNILLKPGRLDEAEFEEMKKHAVYGLNIIHGAQEKIPENEFLRMAADIAYTHHEKWDGSGYPRGLKGAEIPLAGRLMAIADVYDALISKRHYKAPMGHEKAMSIIKEGRGTHFDPELVDAFLEIESDFAEIALKFSD
ncbi:CHASE2 domain-containing protein [Limisalsivibrio acetivorans]|uniref:CHASE2 domain-containing protein n=1 Tax=Limisalsivibrio acetivorans TaxID=1304888 RepID=UPI00138AB8DA|nr:CHASE2 domain-containing protein [Limisalsivibrio acetivorans]